MVAGRYQAMFSGLQMLPFRNPVAVWQVISHKYMRPLVPLAVIVAMLANLAAFLWPSGLRAPAWLLLARPYVWITLALEAGFFLLAGLGSIARFPGALGKVLYVPTFVLNSNFAALKGLYRYFAGQQPVFWARPRDQMSVKKG